MAVKENQKEKKNMTWQWVKLIVVLGLYLLFLYWVKSWLGLIVVPFIFDVYITKKIKWQWWKDSEGPVKFVMSWVDAIVFALVAVYFINIFFFQNYVIPSSSLEKSLLTGDYLFVSKLSYGPRVPQTPLSMPLTQHTLPVVQCKSYIEWPHWDYRRVKGLGDVQLNDIVVFNYPAGDTLCEAQMYQAQDYYQLCYAYGRQMNPENQENPYLNALMNKEAAADSTTDATADSTASASMAEKQLRQMEYYNKCVAAGKQYIEGNQAEFGAIISRPTDRRENYVKRCVGLPGQTLEIRDRIVYLDGKANKEPDNVQYTYIVKLKQNIPDAVMEELGISMEDLMSLNQRGYMPLTEKAANALRGMTDITESVTLNTSTADDGYHIYPINGDYGWTRDNYGPVWIPKKGESIKLTIENLPIYDRPIRVYEDNDLEVKDGKILINGKEADSYTFKMDYYWMMGDNRHNSADSRYWGFVPEDHVVGKPIFIWWSSDPDRSGFKGIRWNRLFKVVDNIK